MGNETTWAIALGGALGALIRGALIRAQLTSGDLSRATLCANAAGCFLIGFWMAAISDSDLAGRSRALAPWVDFFVIVGLCGGLTTFSTLCADATRLLREERSSGIRYLAITSALGVALFDLGAFFGSTGAIHL